MNPEDYNGIAYKLTEVARHVRLALDLLADIQATADGYTFREATAERVEHIITETCRYFDIAWERLLGRGRTDYVATARMVAIYYCRLHTALSSTQLGYRFKRDHGTVLYAFEAVKTRRATDPKFSATLDFLDAKFAAKFSDTISPPLVKDTAAGQRKAGKELCRTGEGPVERCGITLNSQPSTLS